ncbi:hypothetical protein QBC45DRAFT_403447 [Copromyces sp. CBS 386.78]|nr:hypothetical protein QBC45DRAFT_403447 [Copromyces sp. CBS 386.78]
MLWVGTEVVRLGSLTLVFQVALISDVSATLNLFVFHCYTSRLSFVEKVCPTCTSVACSSPKQKDGTGWRLGAPSSVDAGLTDGVRKEPKGCGLRKGCVVAIAVSSKSSWTDGVCNFMLLLPVNGRHCHNLKFVMSRLSEHRQSLDFTVERCRRQQSHDDS